MKPTTKVRTGRHRVFFPWMGHAVIGDIPEYHPPYGKLSGENEGLHHGMEWGSLFWLQSLVSTLPGSGSNVCRHTGWPYPQKINFSSHTPKHLIQGTRTFEVDMGLS